MIWVTVAALAVAALAVASTAAVLRSLIRQQARERDLLLDKIMHLAGRTWTPPPANEPPAAALEQLGYMDVAPLPDY